MNITTLRVTPLANQSGSFTGRLFYWKLRIKQLFNGDPKRYRAEAIEHQGKYYYRAWGVTVEATPHEYAKVIRNPKLYYFSAALKLHQRIARAKVLGLGLDWPAKPAAPVTVFDLEG